MITIIKDITIVNEGQKYVSDVLIEDDIISRIGPDISPELAESYVDGKGKYLLPGVIDDQVHFRDPGLVYKGDIATESRAAIAGGITSYIEQPNTIPKAVTQELLEEKYKLAAEKSYANYGFSIGGTNDNLDEVLKTNPKNVPAVKLFLGSSTGNMLVDDPKVLEEFFTKVKMPICVHCEDEKTIKENTQKAIDKFGEDIPMDYHDKIRSAEACYTSSSKAVELAKKTGARLHVYHLSTERETHLFDNDTPLKDKKITAEVCVHHLSFTNKDYAEKGSAIKWNPAIKSEEDKEGLWKALLDDRIDVIATDHAPHTMEEKEHKYLQCPSGGPLVQHALNAMLDFSKEGKISLEKVVEKMCHNPAILFNIEKRGFIREGYKADLVVVDMHQPSDKVTKDSILYKCEWSPFEGRTFTNRVLKTFVNGTLAYDEGQFASDKTAERLTFNR